MAGITKLIAMVGDDNIKYQVLSTSMTNIQQKKGVSKITFETDAITPQEVITDTGRQGLIIWCDKDAYLNALDELKGK